MLIKMIDGGLVNYKDDICSYGGCPTCDYGSQYINEIYIELTTHNIYVSVKNMYEYAISQGNMIKLFLQEYNAIQQMTEKQFITWFEEKIKEMAVDAHDPKIDYEVTKK